MTSSIAHNLFIPATPRSNSSPIPPIEDGLLQQMEQILLQQTARIRVLVWLCPQPNIWNTSDTHSSQIEILE